ncbi:MAG TPA: hypothetical protein PLJ27_11150 [Polyangiaceae bacterium]|nr:hypothetical protein [Polyangiaceae bacterium]
MIDGLFENPPPFETDLVMRLDKVDKRLARQCLVERLRGSQPTEQETGIYMAAFGQLGLVEQCAAMAEIILDGRMNHRIRAYACGLVASEDRSLAEETMTMLPAHERLAIMDVPYIDLLVWAQADPSAGEQLAWALDSDVMGMTFDRLEWHRKRVGTGAVSAYGAALRNKQACSYHRGMLDALVAESSPEAFVLLRSLRDEETDPALRRDYQAALLRMGTRAIDPSITREIPKGRAFVSSCDHLGDFVILGCMDNPDGSVSIANLCIRADAQIRGGFVLLRQTQQDLQEIFEELDRTGGGFAPLSLQEGAGLVDEALQRMEARGQKVARDVEPAIALFRRASRRKRKSTPDISPALDITMEQVRELMRRPEHARTWILVPLDFEAIRALPPPSHRLDEAWIREAAALWARRGKPRKRILSVVRHMAFWHDLRGEQQQASLCSGLARSMEKQAATSPLVLGLFEKAFMFPKYEPTSLSETITRNYIRKALFSGIRIAKGRDLARLDFIHIAFIFLSRTLTHVDPVPLPKDILLTIADGLATAYVDRVIGDKKRTAGKKSEDLLASCPPAVEDIKNDIVSNLDDFLHEVCAICPIRCIDKPKARMTELFFRDKHPALLDSE